MEHDKISKISSEGDDERIEKDILKNLVYYKLNPGEIPDRIEELEREQDIEKALERNASIVALTGTTFGLLFSKKWLLLPAVVAGFLLQHALKGWSPPLTLLRKMGLRTRKEIDTEKQALKILQGDYDDISSGEENDPSATLEKVKGSTRITTDQPLTTSGFSKRSSKRRTVQEE